MNLLFSRCGSLIQPHSVVPKKRLGQLMLEITNA
jgi:hypothetical protein